ncbi:hypothetical protein H6F73_13255 [Microcoleus sp. FACHB-68]|nr:hypothetical protein [Microcoleus sp. FACHB-68]
MGSIWGQRTGSPYCQHFDNTWWRNDVFAKLRCSLSYGCTLINFTQHSEQSCENHDLLPVIGEFTEL